MLIFTVQLGAAEIWIKLKLMTEHKWTFEHNKTTLFLLSKQSHSLAMTICNYALQGCKTIIATLLQYEPTQSHTWINIFWEAPVVRSCWANQNILTHVHSKLTRIWRCSWSAKDVWRLLKWLVTLLPSVSTANNRLHIS